MGLSVKTRKLLWGNAANMCSFPNCRKRLVIDKTLTDDVSIVGEECHIVAKSENGPRGKSEITQDERDKYDNLILLCNVHHKIIDDQINQYSVDVLKEMKFTHEKWVESTLNDDKSKHNIDLYYADIIDNWEQMADLDDWKGWTSNVLFGGQPSILISKMDQLVELNEWLFNRILPKKYLELEDSLENFRRILNDFIQTFKKYKIEEGNLYVTEKIYKRLNYWDPDKYSLLSKEFDFHVDLVQDLVIELTRAANFVCDKVRKYFLYNYRLDKGILLIMGGPYSDMSFRTYRVEYSTDLEGTPYKNLESFMIDRENRDLHFGRGTKPESDNFNKGECNGT